MGFQENMPFIDLFRRPEYETQVVERLARTPRQARRRPVQGKVILALAGKIQVIGIRLPFDFHTQQVNIEPATGLEILHQQGQMPQTSCCLWPFHRTGCALKAKRPSALPFPTRVRQIRV